MKTKLIQLEKKIEELEALAQGVMTLAEKLSQGLNVQPELSIKGQRWYRGARELLVQQGFSGLDEFDYCYNSSHKSGERRSYTDIEQHIQIGTNPHHDKPWSGDSDTEYFGLFSQYFQKARSLL